MNEGTVLLHPYISKNSFKNVKKVWKDKNYLKKLSYSAKKTNKFYSHYNNYQKLISIYNKVIKNN